MDGNGTELVAPLARMWRRVYQKAAEVAEARTQELLKYHVYVYPHGAGGAAEDIYVDEVGDTMTGTLFIDADEVVSTGAVTVTGRDVVGGPRLFGAASAGFAPGTDAYFAGKQLGARFSVAYAQPLSAVAWYRGTTTQATPTIYRLWKSTDSTTPSWSWATADGITDDHTVGWQETPIPAGAQYACVPGETYTITYDYHTDTYCLQAAFDPVPDAGITWLGSGFLQPYGTDYPWMSDDNYYPIDVVLGSTTTSMPPAQTGAIRLPYGASGAIAWRDSDALSDHTLTINAADQLVFDGVPLSGGSAGGGTTIMYTQTSAPTGATNSLWFNPSEAA